MTQLTAFERFLSLFTNLRPREGYSAGLLCLQAFCLMFSYYQLKVLREPLVLADGSALVKNYATGAQALILLIVVPLFARAYLAASRQEERFHLFRRVMLFFVANLLLFMAAYGSGVAIGVAFYIWLGIFSVMALATFWAYAADLYNPRSGQRLFPLIAAAAALGAFIGSGVTAPIDTVVGHLGVMLMATALLLVPVWLCPRVEGHIPAGSRAPNGDGANAAQPSNLFRGFALVMQSPYLLRIALLVILLNLINTNGDFILTSFVENQANTMALDAESRDRFITDFFGGYIALYTLLSFLIQLFLVSRVYDAIGVRGALLILPIVMILGYAAMALFPLLWVVRAALTAENSFAYSLESTTRHALFLPLQREEKYVGKHTIDTFFFRLGDILSTATVYTAREVLRLSIGAFIGINILLALILLVVSIGIGQRHSGAMRKNLGNLPPVPTRKIDDLQIPVGELTRYSLGEHLFEDPDEGDALSYAAYLGERKQLPRWVRFDALRREFRFEPPAHTRGELDILVIARDFQGLEATVRFRVQLH